MKQIQLGYTIGTLADLPTNQIYLGYTIETLADHPNEPDSARVYNRNLANHYTNQIRLSSSVSDPDLEPDPLHLAGSI